MHALKSRERGGKKPLKEHRWKEGDWPLHIIKEVSQIGQKKRVRGVDVLVLVVRENNRLFCRKRGERGGD